MNVRRDGPAAAHRLLHRVLLELHIEQGPVLEHKNLDIGVVTAADRSSRPLLRIEIEGEGGHAGAVLMPQRRDAFLAGAEVALAVEAAAKGTGAPDTVGTTGICDIFPRARQPAFPAASAWISTCATLTARGAMALSHRFIAPPMKSPPDAGLGYGGKF